jgi:hypothetical protein
VELGFAPTREGYSLAMTTLLWLVAVILVIAGIVNIAKGAVLAGIALILIGCLVGPGGYSLFRG